MQYRYCDTCTEVVKHVAKHGFSMGILLLWFFKSLCLSSSIKVLSINTQRETIHVEHHRTDVN